MTCQLFRNNGAKTKRKKGSHFASRSLPILLIPGTVSDDVGAEPWEDPGTKERRLSVLYESTGSAFPARYSPASVRGLGRQREASAKRNGGGLESGGQSSTPGLLTTSWFWVRQLPSLGLGFLIYKTRGKTACSGPCRAESLFPSSSEQIQHFLC